MFKGITTAYLRKLLRTGRNHSLKCKIYGELVRRRRKGR